MPARPAKSQLVACLTSAATGAAVKKCQDVVLERGSYDLVLYEVATGRKLLAKRLPGDVVRCPNVVPLGTGDRLATTVSDRQLYNQLKKFVVRLR